MIRTATRDDLDELSALFARANDAPYRLERVAEEKCFGAGIAGDPVTRVFMRGEQIAGAAVTCGKWLRVLVVDREHRRQGIGRTLLEDANAEVIGAEPGNYFVPGVMPELAPFFRGYRERASTWNLQVTLQEWDGDAERGDESALEFIEREFGRIWRFEASRAIDNLFVTKERGAITGFVVHDANNRGLGWFGPTGVAKEHRGKGLGKQLLLKSLGAMKKQGYEKAIIPWTDALEFYRKSCGAEPAHSFVALTKVVAK